MQNRTPLTILSGLLVLAAAGCGGGSSGSSADVSIRCANGQAFCLISCDLGCSQTGCAVTEIAENQRLRFVFSSRINPASVNNTNVSIRTPSGVGPAGDFLVSDRELTFVPRVISSGSLSTFGFVRNETYVITLPSGAGGQGIRSVSGDSLSQEFTCTVIASRGIQDEDQQPPTVTLISPATTTGVSSAPTIVLQFSELIDTTPLQGVLTASSPINFVLRGTTSGGTVCDNDAAGVAVQGIPTLSTQTVGNHPVTVVEFKPPLALPGLSCFTVNVTGDLRDLSGRPAVPATFELLTAATVPVPITVTETFANAANMDVDISSGDWNAGAHPGQIGGDGRHGSFDLTLIATPVPNLTNVYEIDTANTVIPGSKTFSGQPMTVTDGKFYFTDFTLPANTTLRFKPSDAITSRPVPQIFVRGKVDILGTFDISAAPMPFWTTAQFPTVPVSTDLNGEFISDFNARYIPSVPPAAPILPTNATSFAPGQPGGFGGIGGGRGGNGGRESNGAVGAGDLQEPPGSGIYIHRGQPGLDVVLPAGHAYAAQSVNTGGRGSMIQPALGTTAAAATPVLAPLSDRLNFAPGGGGGGFLLAGGIAAVTLIPPTAVSSPIQAGGVVFSLAPPSPLPAGFSSLNHYLVGGSGGGGGASHAYGTRNVINNDVYIAGHGGTGGGGTMAIRAGGKLTIALNARLESKGGRGVLITGDDKVSASRDLNWGISSPGGGGSGGSFLVQSGRDLVASGTIDTAGAAGSSINKLQVGATAPTFNVRSTAGSGSAGFYRLEAAGNLSFGGTGTPAYVAGLHSGPLTDTDAVTASQSTWRSSGQFFPPTWLRYELDVDLDGDGTVDIVYTDSGAAGTQKANDPLGPVTILFQGARLNQDGTAPLPTETPKPWREGIGAGSGPGINLDSPTGFRFLLRFNRDAGSPNVVVRALRVYCQG